MDIMEATSVAFGIDRDILMSPLRTDAVAQARFAAMLVYHRHGFSLPAVARATGRKDHTTCIHGISRAEQLEACDLGYRMAVQFIERNGHSPVEARG